MTEPIDKEPATPPSHQNSRELDALAEKAKEAGERAGSAIDDAIAYIEASNKRIALMELAAAKFSKKDS